MSYIIDYYTSLQVFYMITIMCLQGQVLDVHSSSFRDIYKHAAIDYAVLILGGTLKASYEFWNIPTVTIDPPLARMCGLRQILCLDMLTLLPKKIALS